MKSDELLVFFFRILKQAGREVPQEEIPGLVRVAHIAQEDWNTKFAPQDSEGVGVGSFVRMQDDLLRSYALPVPSTILVLNQPDATSAMCAPVLLREKWPHPIPTGVLWLRDEQSPFSSRTLVDLRRVTLFNVSSLSQFGRVLARIKQVPENQVRLNEDGEIDLTQEDHEAQQAWQRFADALAGMLPT